jgi:hypothetical protein
MEDDKGHPRDGRLMEVVNSSFADINPKRQEMHSLTNFWTVKGIFSATLLPDSGEELPRQC